MLTGAMSSQPAHCPRHLAAALFIHSAASACQGQRRLHHHASCSALFCPALRSAAEGFQASTTHAGCSLPMSAASSSCGSHQDIMPQPSSSAAPMTCTADIIRHRQLISMHERPMHYYFTRPCVDACLMSANRSMSSDACAGRGQPGRAQVPA